MIKQKADYPDVTVPDDTDEGLGALPGSEDRSKNTFRIHQGRDGRYTYHGNADALTGQKLEAAINSPNRPVSEPDGSSDARDVEQRNADAMEIIVDHFLDSGHAPTDGGDRPPHPPASAARRPRIRRGRQGYS